MRIQRDLKRCQALTTSKYRAPDLTAFESIGPTREIGLQGFRLY